MKTFNRLSNVVAIFFIATIYYYGFVEPYLFIPYMASGLIWIGLFSSLILNAPSIIEHAALLYKPYSIIRTIYAVTWCIAVASLLIYTKHNVLAVASILTSVCMYSHRIQVAKLAGTLDKKSDVLDRMGLELKANK